MAIAEFTETTAESFSDQLLGTDTRRRAELNGARTVRNGMIGKEAASNARSIGTADVIAAGKFVRDLDFTLGVMGSGHTVGAADGEDVVIGPAPINTVWVDEPGERIDDEGTQSVFELIDELDNPSNLLQHHRGLWRQPDSESR